MVEPVTPQARENTVNTLSVFVDDLFIVQSVKRWYLTHARRSLTDEDVDVVPIPYVYGVQSVARWFTNLAYSMIPYGHKRVWPVAFCQGCRLWNRHCTCDVEPDALEDWSSEHICALKELDSHDRLTYRMMTSNGMKVPQYLSDKIENILHRQEVNNAQSGSVRTAVPQESTLLSPSPGGERSNSLYKAEIHEPERDVVSNTSLFSLENPDRVYNTFREQTEPKSNIASLPQESNSMEREQNDEVLF